MKVEKCDVGNELWRTYMSVLKAARGQSERLPRGGAQVGAFPVDNEPSKLPAEWKDDVAHASHVVYRYGTPVAWVDGRDGVWVVPEVFYSVQTMGVQNRIRACLGGNYRDKVTA